MTATPQPLWTIDQLGAQAALALAVEYEGAPNGRIRDVPDRRTIRYYTTLGLLDRPAEIRGRTAFYGPRHLLQLAAIKRLQARGLSLAEVQQRLLGVSERELRQLAQISDELFDVPESAATVGSSEPPGDSRAGSFWSTAPAPVLESAARAAPESPDSESVESGAAGFIQGVRLYDGVTLLLETTQSIHEQDVTALRVAAAPLLKLLQKRRLIRPRNERRTP
jgi:hypothetical protein